MSTGSAITDICQACRRAPVEAVVVDHDPEQPYRVCQACESRLQLHALRPLEWFNLAALHGPDKHLLHDDFYYDNGIAEQPEEDVEEPEKYPAPTLPEAEGDLERLIDYAMTRYFLERDVAAALEHHPKEHVLSALRQRVGASKNIAVESMSYDVCSLVVGAVAGDWIRERWESYRPEILQPLAQASARCLPFEEGFQRVTEKLESRLLIAGLDEDCSVLRHFQSPETLQWIEAQEDWLQAHQESSRIERWGEIAAHSRFSWPKAAQWLKRGRPLSRVAMAALAAISAYQRHERKPRWEAPVLEDPAPLEVMIAALETYRDTDPFPPVAKHARQIQQVWRTDTEYLP